MVFRDAHSRMFCCFAFGAGKAKTCLTCFTVGGACCSKGNLSPPRLFATSFHSIAHLQAHVHRLP